MLSLDGPLLSPGPPGPPLQPGAPRMTPPAGANANDPYALPPTTPMPDALRLPSGPLSGQPRAPVPSTQVRKAFLRWYIHTSITGMLFVTSHLKCL